MSGGAFNKVYADRVLDPAFSNWKKLYQIDALRVHRAHLCMLAETGIITSDVAKALKAGIETVEATFIAPDRIPDGVEDLYFLFENELERWPARKTPPGCIRLAAGTTWIRRYFVLRSNGL